MMESNYAQLVKALRYCADGSRMDCSDCEYEPHYDCTERLKKDAAAAIEALQKDLTTIQKCYEIADTTVDKVAKQLPKLGEWIPYEFNTNGTWHKCSVCGVAYQYKDAPNSGWWINHKYCPNCGAKMMEVQDGK